MSKLKFRVLGPVEALRDGQLVTLGSGKKVTLLAGLLVSANHVVPAGTLADLTLEPGTAEHPRAALQTGISRLRRLLGPDVIDNIGGGYRIRVAADDLDLLRFGRLVEFANGRAADGSAEAALAALDEALALWRDPVMGNVRGAVLLRDVLPGLIDQRLDAQEQHAQLCLRFGRHEYLTGQLAELVRSFPFRERLVSSLMLALYRSGRQADALAAYEALRTNLREELGIDPGPETQVLHLRILRGEPDLRFAGGEIRGRAQLTRGDDADSSGGAAGAAADTGRPRQLPPDIAFFTGRADELAAVRDALAGDRPAAARIVTLAGPGGVGKTALAVRAAHELAGEYPDGQLYVNLQGVSARPADPGEVLARFLRGLGVAGSAVPADADERSALFRSIVAGRRVLIVLDDAAGEGQVRPLLPAGARCGVIVTSRAPMTGLPGGGRPLVLSMLDNDQAVMLLGLIAGSGRVAGQRADARAIARLCGGLPLALRIAGARLAARPHWQLAVLAGRLEDGRRRLGELRHSDLDVRASLALSYQGLNPRAQLLFRRIGLLGTPDFPAWAAAALLDVSVRQAGELIDSLIDAQLLAVAGRSSAGQRFGCHDLVRDFARELARADDQAVCRSALGRVFGALLGLAEHAHRGVYGGDYTIMHGRAPRWRAPDMVPAQLIAEAPMTWFEGERLAIGAAVRQGAESGMDELCWDLAWTAVTLFEAASYYDDWRTVEQEALAAARRAGNRRGEAAMLASLGACMLAQQSYGAGRDLCEQAARLFTDIGDQHGHALALRSLALADRLSGRLDSSLARAQLVRSAARVAADRFMEAAILRDMASTYLELGDLDRAAGCVAEALPISREIGSARAQALVLHEAGELHLRQGQHGQAEHAFGEALRFARTSEDRLGQAYSRIGLALARVGLGRCGEAVSLLREVLDAVRQLRHRIVEGRVLLALGKAEAGCDDHAAATGSLLASLAIFADCGLPLKQAAALDALATVYLDAGEHGAAQRAGRQASELRAFASEASSLPWRA